MKPFSRILNPGLIAAVVAGCGISSAEAQAEPQGNPAPVFTLRPAVVISMPTEAGKVYQLQTSPNLETWKDHGAPVFGDGTPIQQPMIGAGHEFFRLKVLTQPAMGLAPWSPAGQNYVFNEGHRIVQTSFAADGHGTCQSGTAPTPHAWTWQRTSFSEARAELTLPEDTREVLYLTFSAPQAGRFVRWVYQGDDFVETYAGSFGPQPAQTAAGTGPLVPASLNGRTLAFCDQPTGGSLTLNSSTTGTRLLEGASLTFHGNWLVTGINSARITATFSPTHGEEYRFTFTTPTCGRFTRQTFTEGIFRDADEGTFCLTNPP